YYIRGYISRKDTFKEWTAGTRLRRPAGVGDEEGRDKEAHSAAFWPFFLFVSFLASTGFKNRPV
ncbi:MAG: hypothetical protein Q7V40_21605, partial [Pseudolabrys sp.]|nr:hypothetical protein [Pseudolabrys sp.]